MDKSELNLIKSDESNNMDKEIEKIRNINYKIQVDRVLYIFKRLIKKLEIMSHLPFMVKNDGEFLRKYLSDDDVYFILQVCEYYLYSDRSVVTDSDYTNVLMNINYNAYEFEPHVMQIIDLITYNEELINNLKNADTEQRVDVNLVKVMQTIDKLYEILQDKLSMNEKEQTEYEEQLKRTYLANLKMEEDIKSLQEQIRKQNDELGGQLRAKQDILDKYMECKHQIQENFQKHINEFLYSSEKSMMEATDESMEKQHELSTTSKRVTEEYHNLLQNNLNDEKTLRTKRYKVETQLFSWITKYDADIGEKQQQIEDLQQQFDGIQTEMNELQERFDEQEKDYKIMFAEKEAEEEAYLNKLAYEFLRNRAAKRIQKAWTEYWARKLARKKGRKKKGGKDKKKKT